MGISRPPEEACLLVGVLCKEKTILNDFPETLNEFGPPFVSSPVIPFDFTDYYRTAMGRPLFRRFYLYPPGFPMETLADVKIRTNTLEGEAARFLDLGVSRPLNLDPGYLTLSKLVLASTKDNAHRLYLRDGIYAELTLTYRKKSYQPWPWTYPDYASKSYLEFFNRARQQLFP